MAATAPSGLGSRAAAASERPGVHSATTMPPERPRITSITRARPEEYTRVKEVVRSRVAVASVSPGAGSTKVRATSRPRRWSWAFQNDCPGTPPWHSTSVYRPPATSPPGTSRGALLAPPGRLSAPPPERLSSSATLGSS